MKNPLALAFMGALGACSANDPTPPDMLPSAGQSASMGATGGALAGGASGAAAGGAGTSGAAPGGGAGTSSGGSAGSASGGASGAGAASQGGTGGSPTTSGGSATGGGGSGGGGVAGSTSACPPHAQLCLDFENGDYPGWNKREAGGKITVDDAFARHGTRSLLITTPANQRGGMLENHGAPLFPLPNHKMWGRILVYFEGVPDGHTDLIRGSGANGAGPNYNVGEQHDSVMLNYYAGSRATDCWARPKPEKKVPDRTWMCWEWSFDSATNGVEYWLDGALLRTVSGTGDGCLEGNGAWKAPPSFESVSVGEQIAELSPTTAFKLWIDDVAVSNSARVGCP